MARLTVLLTNHTLANRGGSELYARDVATALLARGHRPIVYSPRLGAVAEDLRLATVPVTDDLRTVAEPPDVIHGHHHLETMTALLRFPGVPAVFVSHGWLPFEEAPPRFPRILRYVAVDDVCRDRLVCQHGLPAEDVEVLLNFVDTDRFAPRGPLPARPGSALLFSHEDGPHVPVVRDACARAGIPLDVVGRDFGNASEFPESILGRYDLVFAKARSALEAMAVGAAVVPVARYGVGPMVTSAGFDELRRLNFGIRVLRLPLTADTVAAQIARYDAEDAGAVSRQVRACARREDAVDRLLEIYAGVLECWRSRKPPSAEDEARAASSYLHSLSPALKWAAEDRRTLLRRLEDAEAAPSRLREELAATGTRLAQSLDTIQHMERSLFWRARALYRSVRRGLGVPD
jgi:hypothetical protein